MIKSKKNILFYYMNGNSAGGSDNSLYLHLINLNINYFTPIVIYKKESTLVKKIISKNFITIHQNYFSSSFKKSSIIFKLPGSKTLYFNLRVIKEVIKLLKVINKYNVHIIHINNTIRTNRAAAIAGLLTSKKVIVHDRVGIKLGVFDKFLVKRVSKIITISKSVEKCYAGLKLSEDKLFLIYNGIDTSKFNFQKKKKSDDIVVGSVGRLVRWKGIHVLLAAFAKVLNSNKYAKLLVIGDGEERKRLEALTKELRIQNNVIFLGNVENIHDLYKSLDIFIHAAIEPEPFGRVIIEAMASGVPVISTNIGGPLEIISNKKDGFLIPPGNSQVLAERIIYLIENKKMADEITSNAISKVNKYFDARVITKKIENLYLG